MKIYLAPLEGITGWIYRGALRECFGGFDKYFVPFISPNQKGHFSSREKKDILPANNGDAHTVPQILTNNAEDFLRTAEKLEEYGYGEVNLNLGCPSRTVVTKGRGSGFLAFPERLEGFLDSIFRECRLKISVKTRINGMMWDTEDHFYYDLDKDEQRIRNKHIGCFWTMLAEIPNNEYAAYLIEELKDENEFGTENPFPSVPASSPFFSKEGNGYCGGVASFFIYMVVKGLMNYGSFVFARECSIRHMYFILDTLHPDSEKQGDSWEIYRPASEGPAAVPEGMENRRRYLPMLGLVSVALMIENIIGLEISLPRKTVNWTMQSLEEMGIEDLSLKKNSITILSNKNARGWEIRLESEKLYYFTIHILEEDKKKTLPIPSGKCSMLIDKL